MSLFFMVMDKKSFKYIYGPVPSWRLGSSLGVDLLSGKKKICSFDCIYCQLGKAKAVTTKRRLYVPTQKVIEEIRKLPKVRIDYITFSGRGEPTLAINLGRTIKAIKKLRQEPIAVLTNSSLMHRAQVRKELALADFVIAKLDADCQNLFKQVNQPAKNIKFVDILKSIKQFRKEYRGKLALQIMFMDKNKSRAGDIAKIACDIRPDEIQINTPRRPSHVKPLSQKAILEIRKYFRAMKVISVYPALARKGGAYDMKRKTVQPISSKDAMLRRGKILE